MKKTLLASIAALALPAFAIAGPTLTGTTTQTFTFSYVPSDIASFTFDQFNAASISGSNITLTGVTVSLSITKTGGQVQADNDSTSNFGTVTLTQSVTTLLTSTVYIPVLLQTGLTVTTSTSGYVSTTTGDELGVFNATHSSDFLDSGIFEPVSTGTTRSVSSEYWNGGYSDEYDKTFTSYIGTGTYVLSATSSQRSSADGVGGVNYGVNVASETGTVTVTYIYDYEAIPEPSTWAMILGGSGVLAFAQRLRRRLS